MDFEHLTLNLFLLSVEYENKHLVLEVSLI